MTKYVVRRYFSGYCTNEVVADNVDDALLIARKNRRDDSEILETLETWEDADDIVKEGG